MCKESNKRQMNRKYKSWPNLHDSKYFINETEDNMDELGSPFVKKEFKNQAIQTDYIFKNKANISCEDLMNGFYNEEEQETYKSSSKSNKKDGFTLKHQLTRDSGIDTDNNQVNFSNISSRAQQIFSNSSKKSNEDENIEKSNEQLNPIKSSSTIVKTSAKRPNSLTIRTTTDIKNKFISSTSTRDNSIDEIENSEHDDIMVNLFNRNVIDEDEISENLKLEEESEPDCDKLSTNEDEFNMRSISNSNSSYDVASNKRKIFKGKIFNNIFTEILNFESLNNL